MNTPGMEVVTSKLKCIILSIGFLLFFFGGVNSQTTTQSDDVTASSVYTPCPAGQTLCKNGTGCYPLGHICDGIPDCGDGSDEVNCPTLPQVCPEQQKRCPDGSCIDPSLQCPVLSKNTTSSLAQQSTTQPVTPASSSYQPDRPSVHMSSTEPQTDITSSVHVTKSNLFTSDIELPSSLPPSMISVPTSTEYSEQLVQTSSVRYGMETTIQSTHTSYMATKPSSITSDVTSSLSEQVIRSSEDISTVLISTSTEIPMMSSSNVPSSTDFLSTNFTTSSLMLHLNSSVSVSSVNHTSRVTVSGVITQSYSESASTRFVSSDDVTSRQTSSDFLTSRIFQSTATIIQSSPFMSSSVDIIGDLTSDSATSSLQSPSFLYTTRMMTSSTETPSLTLQPTETFSMNPTNLKSSTDIRPSKTFSEIHSSSIMYSDTVTSSFNRSSTVAPPVNEPLLPWVIALIVCGSVIFLYFVYLIYVLCTKKHKLTKYKMDYEDPEDDFGYRRSIVKRPGHDYVSFDNKVYHEQPGTPDSEVDNPFNFRNLRNSDFRNDNNN